MNSTIWKQTDSRWASKAYPSGSTVGGCGCGLLACTHVAMEQESKKNWTPDNLRSWMVSKGFAIKGQGTKWEGITETLKYIGHKSVVRVYSDPMSVAWKELNKGNRIGILLFNSHTAPNGVKWTASGHYVAFTGYKVEGGKHYFYTKDSGGRNHSGWYTYENSMKGCIAKVWIVERVGKQTNGSATVATSASTVTATTYKPTSAYSGSLPTSVVKNGSKGASAKAVQQFLNWCINAKLSVDSIAGAKTVNAIKIYQKTYGLTVDGIFGSASKSKAQSIINQYKPKSTATHIGQACADYDKKAGDSSGKEVTKSSFTYSSSSTSPYNWTYVFRPKDSAKAEKAATMCEKAIANNAIGYNSHGETAYGKDKAMTKLAKAVNYDLSKVKTKCGLSCGDLICLCNHWAGLSTCYIGSGLQLANNYKKNSNFSCLSYKKGMTLKRGDVLITAHSNGKNNHVAMVL